MYVRRLRLDNVRCFRSLDISFEQNGEPRRWTILAGPNGTGKTTLLRAIAASWGDAHSDKGRGSQLPPVSWVRNGADSAQVVADFEFRSSESAPGAPRRAEHHIPARDAQPTSSTLPSGASSRGSLIVGIGPTRIGSPPFVEPGFTRQSQGEDAAHRGSLAALYGWPVDRLDRLYAWIRWEDFVRLKNEKAEAHRPSVLTALAAALETLFDGAARFREVDTRGQILFDTDDGPVSLEDLADGLRSTFVIVAELLLRLDVAFPSSPNPTQEEAICLVDELDAHLHPRLQRTVVPALRKLFPNVQFIVTTHSPYVVGSALAGEVVVLSRRAGAVVAQTEGVPDVSGWTADAIATSPIFGLDTTRDLRGEHALDVERKLLAKPELSADERRALGDARTLLDRADGPVTTMVRELLVAPRKVAAPKAPRKRSRSAG